MTRLRKLEKAGKDDLAGAGRLFLSGMEVGMVLRRFCSLIVADAVFFS
jgi:hypothetical protein